MGKIQRFSKKVIVRLGADEILTVRVGAKQDYTFCLSEMIIWHAAVKLAEKGVEIPCGPTSLTFDKVTGEYIITFLHSVEDFVPT